MAGNLDDIRDQSRAAIHAKFALPAVISDSGGSAIGTAHVRLHLADSRAFGDLDREGFAQVIEDVNRMIFLTAEAKPERKGVVEMDDGRQYVIDTVQPSLDGLTVSCDVASKKVAA